MRISPALLSLLLLSSLGSAFLRPRWADQRRSLLSARAGRPAAAAKAKPPREGSGDGATSDRDEETPKAAPRKRKPKAAPTEPITATSEPSEPVVSTDPPARKSRRKAAPSIVEHRVDAEGLAREEAIAPVTDESLPILPVAAVKPEPIVVALTPEELQERKEQLLEAARRKTAQDEEGSQRARALADYILHQVPDENKAVSRLRQNKNALLASLRWSAREGDLEEVLDN